MVFVGMGENHACNFRLSLFEVRHVGDHIIDPQHVVFRKHQTGIDNKQRVAVFKNHHIEADFSQPAQGDYF